MPRPDEEVVGDIEMHADRSISIATTVMTDNFIGDAVETIAPDDPEYDYIIAQIGGLEPGQIKPVTQAFVDARDDDISDLDEEP